MIERDVMIDKLVCDDINTIFDMKDQYNDESTLAQMLEFGFRGYEDYSDDELYAELQERELLEQYDGSTIE